MDIKVLSKIFQNISKQIRKFSFPRFLSHPAIKMFSSKVSFIKSCQHHPSKPETLKIKIYMKNLGEKKNEKERILAEKKLSDLRSRKKIGA